MTAMIVDTDWMRHGACVGVTRDLFFPEEGQLVDPIALNLCGRCEVRNECLNWALEQHVEFGIWGGLTEMQRRSVERRRHRVRCPDCQSDNVVEDVRSEICLNCGLSWII